LTVSEKKALNRIFKPRRQKSKKVEEKFIIRFLVISIHGTLLGSRNAGRMFRMKT
jgi:hypothetical protein